MEFVNSNLPPMKVPKCKTFYEKFNDGGFLKEKS